MSNKNTQKTAAANGGGKKQRAKVSDTSIDNISDATRKKIEKIKTVTEWQVSEDIFNLLRDCNFDENLTIEKIITGAIQTPIPVCNNQPTYILMKAMLGILVKNGKRLPDKENKR